MISRDYAMQMAAYNRWMNEQLYACVAQLAPTEQHAERGAFFGSLHGTLNHILLGDTLWLQRFAQHPAAFPALQPLTTLPRPVHLRQQLADNFDELQRQRRALDDIIEQWCAQLTPAALAQPLCYHSLQNQPACKDFAALIVHFFNHQTHHRGQASTLLSQLGVDIGATDLLLLLPNR